MAISSLIERKVNDIVSTVRSLSSSGNRLRYYISVFNPSISSKPIEMYKGSNADNSKVDAQQEWYYGADMVQRLAEQLHDAVDNQSNVRVEVVLKDGASKEICKFQIVLREEYADNVPTYTATQPQQQPQQSIQGLGSLNELLGMAFGGLGGAEATNGLGAILGVRDQIIRSDYERRDTERKHDYECRDYQRRIDELTEQVQRLTEENKQIAILTEENKRLSEQVAEQEKSNEPTIAGIALSGVAARAAETLLLRHAGTVGKLFGVGKDEMLGMLTGDLSEEQSEEQSMPQPQVVASPIVEEPQIAVVEPTN